MKNFTYSIPTVVHFGEGQIKKLGAEIAARARRVLVVYGGGSVKRNGVFDAAVAQLKAHNVQWAELPGVEPNPRIATVREGVRLCREQGLDGVLALGGGSVIDCDPAVSILDPTYTYSLPAAQTAAGTADIMSHTFENYFSPIEDNYLAESLAEAILRSCVKYGPKAIETPDDYEARANLMWNAAWAINGFLDMGKPVAWSVHRMEHELSAFYDVTHGVGLAILTPNWMRYVLNEKTEARFARYGTAVWGLDPALPLRELAERAIQKTRDFFASLGLPATLSELGIGPEYFPEMARKARNSGFDRTFVPLSVEDIIHIYQMSL